MGDAIRLWGDQSSNGLSYKFPGLLRERPSGYSGRFQALDLPGYRHILRLKVKEHLYFCSQIPSIPLERHIAHVRPEETEAQRGFMICPGLQSPVGGA